MSKLTVQNLGDATINVGPGQTVLQALQAAGIDWMHACGGKGRCTSCRMIVKTGLDQISPLTAAEQKYREAGRLKTTERLTCQCTLLGDVTARVPNQTKLPHMQYSS